MSIHRRDFARIAASVCVYKTCTASSHAAEDGWIDLIGGTAHGLDAFLAPRGYWKQVDSVTLDPASPKQLKWAETTVSTGIWVNGANGRTNNLVSVQQFGDVEVKLDFNVPKGSNSGIKLQGLYEIQIYDSHGVAKEKFNASGMGGVYPRAELLPRYHHISDSAHTHRACLRSAGSACGTNLSARRSRPCGVPKREGQTLGQSPSFLTSLV